VRLTGSALDEQQRTFLAALAHYAALAVERVRLVAEAERAEALREADRLKDMVLASVSHDLRTPLTTIKALAHAAAVRGEADAVVIEEQADRLSRMVADLLDLSRARGGALPLDVQINTVEDLIGAAARQVSGLLGGRALLKPSIAGEEPLVGRFDFVAALRALGNLLENALKYSPPDAAVEVTAGRLGDMLAVSVADRGPGIPVPDQSRIFTPFYRSECTPADVGGAGLGLAVARTLAEAQGGSLTYTPRAGGGSVFTLRLPAAEVAEADLAPELETPAGAHAAPGEAS
jgi:two-component system sensor histidine kinase KdpD